MWRICITFPPTIGETIFNVVRIYEFPKKHNSCFSSSFVYVEVLFAHYAVIVWWCPSPEHRRHGAWNKRPPSKVFLLAAMLSCKLDALCCASVRALHFIFGRIFRSHNNAHAVVGWAQTSEKWRESVLSHHSLTLTTALSLAFAHYTDNRLLWCSLRSLDGCI